MLENTTLSNDFQLTCWKTQRFSTFSRSYRSYRGGRDMQRLLSQIFREVFRKVFLSFAEGFARVGAPSRALNDSRTWCRAHKYSILLRTSYKKRAQPCISLRTSFKLEAEKCILLRTSFKIQIICSCRIFRGSFACATVAKYLSQIFCRKMFSLLKIIFRRSFAEFF